MVIDIEQLNTLISIWVGVGIVLLISLFAVAIVIVCYFLSKISDLDNKHFENKVNTLIDKYGKHNSKD